MVGTPFEDWKVTGISVSSLPRMGAPSKDVSRHDLETLYRTGLTRGGHHGFYLSHKVP
jgi:hypothetical protein